VRSLEILALVLLCGCPCHKGDVTEPPAAGPAAQAPATEAPASQQPEPPSVEPSAGPGTLPVPSTWSGPACEGRAYERVISFQEQGRFEARDLVSPCPPGTVCVWSGVITRGGSWSMARADIQLAPDPTEAASGGPPASQFPLPLMLRRAPDGQLEEPGSDCRYAQTDR